MKTKLTVGIICAMDSEISGLISSIQNIETVTIADLVFHVGEVSDKIITIVKCGVGKVNAARCTQLLIDRFQPDLIINSGIAGGIDPELSVGDIVIAAEFIQHDFDVTAFGHAKGYLCTGECDDRPTVFRSDERLVSLLEETVRRADTKTALYKGRIATGDLFVSDSSMKQRIYREFHAAAVEMEGAAIAQTAAYSKTPFVAIRVISDQADGSAAESFEIFEKKTAELSSAVIVSFLKLI